MNIAADTAVIKTIPVMLAIGREDAIDAIPYLSHGFVEKIVFAVDPPFLDGRQPAID